MSLNDLKVQDFFSLVDNNNILNQDIIHLNLQCERQEQQVLSILNREISTTKTRLNGLQKLNVFIDYCSNDTILANAFNWINVCLIQHDGDYLKELKLKTVGKYSLSNMFSSNLCMYEFLGNIIENSYKNPEFSKKFVADYIAKIVESCLAPHDNEYDAEVALTTLAICMKRYASWFTNYKLKIETYTVMFLDNSSDTLVEKAAIVFLNLQQV